MGRSGKAGESMSAQWFNPLEETPEGRLLKDVQDLLKEVKNKDKADLDKDGKLSSYEKKRGKAIEESMARQGYKSDRGQKPAPSLPKAKKNKTVIKFDASDNCPLCNANPHEECGLQSHDNHRAIDCLKNPISYDSRFDDMREGYTVGELMDDMFQRSDEKNMNCSVCNSELEKNMDCHRCNMSKAEMDEKNRYCQKKFGRKYSECTPKQKAQCDRECGKGDEVKKYSQEPSVDNLFPQFQNVDGGQPVNAHGFTTRGTYPATNDGPKKSIVSETAKMPAFAKTEYTPKGSSLHMHYNDAGGTRATPNVDSIEQHLASLTKHAGRHNLGMIGEIEGLLKQVKDRMKDPSN
jgi:hypothetical protein